MTESTDPPRRISRPERDRAVSRVLWHVLWLNLFVAGLKLLFGYLAGSVSMVADGFHSALDASSNVVGLVGLNAARKEADADHPYGHRKFEALAALGIAIFLILTCWEIVTSVIGRFGSSEHLVRPSYLTFGAMVLSMGVSWMVSRYEAAQGRELKSLILLADAKHTQSDVFTSLGVIASLVAALLGFPALDLVAALAIAALIAYLAYSVVASSFSVLADSQVVDPEEVLAIVRDVEGVTGAHRVRSRGLPDDIHIDFHLHVPPDMPISRAHDLAHQASGRVREQISGVTDVVVHIEPEDDHEH